MALIIKQAGHVSAVAIILTLSHCDFFSQHALQFKGIGNEQKFQS